MGRLGIVVFTLRHLSSYARYPFEVQPRMSFAALIFVSLVAGSVTGSPWYLNKKSRCFEGQVGKSKIHLTLFPEVDGSIQYPQGVYFYDRIQIPLYIEGFISNQGELTLYVINNIGRKTGEWREKFSLSSHASN